MDKIDLRKLNNDELYTVRKQVVRLKKKGMKGSEISDLVGIYENRISQIWTMYQKGGIEGIKPKKSGRKPKSNMLLDALEQAQIKSDIISKTPEQLKLAGFLWTRKKICAHTAKKLGKKISQRSMSNYLKRWGLTCQRPTKRACGQDIERIKKFMREEYPAIAKRAKIDGADIYWGDETGVSNTENFERGFAPKGTPPVLSVVTKRQRVNMISAINNEGHVRFMVYEKNMNQELLIDFFRRLIRETPRKVYLILDNLRVHHGKIVKAWLAKHAREIEVFYLPPYAPEYNPPEYLNNALKHSVHSGLLPKTKTSIKSKMHSFMRKLQHDKEKVRKFFMHEKVSYCLVLG